MKTCSVSKEWTQFQLYTNLFVTTSFHFPKDFNFQTSKTVLSDNIPRMQRIIEGDFAQFTDLLQIKAGNM